MQEEIRRAQAFLASAQLTDGSWPYYSNTDQGYPEPTCYCLLALRDGALPKKAQTSAADWLAARVNEEGILTLDGDRDPNWGTSHLIIALTHLQTAVSVRQRSIDWLLTWQSNPTEPSAWIPMDGSLIGWPWISNTYSWVEPTSYAMLALKLNGHGAHPRVLEAAKLLQDRACVQGGWNVGNPIVLGRALEGFVPTTAIALMALHGTTRVAQESKRGLAFLQEETLRFPSSLSLALAILCLLLYELPVAPYVDRLLARQQSDGSWRQMTQVTALSVLALQATAGGHHVFKA